MCVLGGAQEWGTPSGRGKLYRRKRCRDSGHPPCQRVKFSPKSSVHRCVSYFDACHKGLGEPISQKARVKMWDVFQGNRSPTGVRIRKELKNCHSYGTEVTSHSMPGPQPPLYARNGQELWRAGSQTGSLLSDISVTDVVYT